MFFDERTLVIAAFLSFHPDCDSGNGTANEFISSMESQPFGGGGNSITGELDDLNGEAPLYWRPSTRIYTRRREHDAANVSLQF
jgi:hypothetical protein